MKKRLLSVITVMLVLFATSCTNNDFEKSEDGGEAAVNFTTQLASGLSTRAISDGTTATGLTCAVYDDAWTLIPAAGTTTTFSSLQATVSLNLVTGKTYNIVFWAQAADAPYTFNQADATMTVNYAAVANAENRDAFFHVEKVTVNGNISKDITLLRPFAQLNILTDDFEAATKAGTTVVNTSVEVKAYSTLSFKDGAVSDPVDVAFTPAAFPTETFTLNSKEYTWLSMNYLLMGEKEVLDKITFKTDDATQDYEFTQIPVQRNFRTNIYGSLLTNKADYKVIINPAYEVEDYLVEPWDGFSRKAVTPNADGVYEISAPAELAWLGDEVNIRYNKFTDVTVKLMADINMNNKEMAAIGS